MTSEGRRGEAWEECEDDMRRDTSTEMLCIFPHSYTYTHTRTRQTHACTHARRHVRLQRRWRYMRTLGHFVSTCLPINKICDNPSLNVVRNGCQATPIRRHFSSQTHASHVASGRQFYEACMLHRFSQHQNLFVFQTFFQKRQQQLPRGPVR